MNKQQILDEIKRTAEINRGTALGRERFFQETGIKEADWFGKYWVRWSEAVQEAGLTPNKLRAPHSEKLLIGKYIELIRELGRIPVKGDLRLKRRADRSFPNDKTFNRWGSKGQILAKAVEYCQAHTGYEDILQLCIEAVPKIVPETPTPADTNVEESESVYLLKSGRYYKIGRTNALGRREYELAIQLPEKAQMVHVIRTDHSAGIEAHWHNRFAQKRANGEWFALDASEVQAFKRRRFM